VNPRRRNSIGAAALLLIAWLGSAVAGDLGRADPSIFEGILPKQFYLGPAAPLAFPPRFIPHSLYPLTDDEERLRNQSYALIRPPQHRDVWNLLVASNREAKILPLDILSFDRRAYGKMLVGLPYRSEAGRYSRLTDDVVSDVVLLGPFLATACRVLDMDAKRMRSLGYVQELTDSERGNARARIRENQLVIELVEYALDERAWSYRYAAERLVLAVPSPLAVQAEQSIGRFQALLTGIDDYLVQCRGAASLLPDDEAVPVRPLVTK